MVRLYGIQNDEKTAKNGSFRNNTQNKPCIYFSKDIAYNRIVGTERHGTAFGMPRDDRVRCRVAKNLQNLSYFGSRIFGDRIKDPGGI